MPFTIMQRKIMYITSIVLGVVFILLLILVYREKKELILTDYQNKVFSYCEQEKNSVNAELDSVSRYIKKFYFSSEISSGEGKYNINYELHKIKYYNTDISNASFFTSDGRAYSTNSSVEAVNKKYAEKIKKNGFDEMWKAEGKEGYECLVYCIQDSDTGNVLVVDMDINFPWKLFDTYGGFLADSDVYICSDGVCLNSGDRIGALQEKSLSLNDENKYFFDSKNLWTEFKIKEKNMTICFKVPLHDINSQFLTIFLWLAAVYIIFMVTLHIALKKFSKSILNMISSLCDKMENYREKRIK